MIERDYFYTLLFFRKILLIMSLKPPVDIMGCGSWRFAGARQADGFGFIQQRNTFILNSERDSLAKLSPSAAAAC